MTQIDQIKHAIERICGPVTLSGSTVQMRAEFWNGVVAHFVFGQEPGDRVEISKALASDLFESRYWSLKSDKSAAVNKMKSLAGKWL